MALVPCKECGKEVSDKAKSCPNCGLEDPGKEEITYEENPSVVIFAWIMTALIAAAIIYGLW